MAADEWLTAKRDGWAPKTFVIESTNLNHLKPAFGKSLLSDIGMEEVVAYRAQRLRAQAAPETISLELGTLCAVMLHHNLDTQWAAIRKVVKLKKALNIGRAITRVEEAALLESCRGSRSRSVVVIVTVALQSCMRTTEIRLLQWKQVDFARRVVTVGKSKTDAGTGREIPMTVAAYQALSFWAADFPGRKPNHYVFPYEQYGGKARPDHFAATGGCVYSTAPTQPVGTWKEAWEEAKKRAGVECRFHDLRHTACTRMLEAGVSHVLVADIMGWSASTAIRMIKEVYGHVGLDAKRTAMEQFENSKILSGWAQKWAQSEGPQEGKVN